MPLQLITWQNSWRRKVCWHLQGHLLPLYSCLPVCLHLALKARESSTAAGVTSCEVTLQWSAGGGRPVLEKSHGDLPYIIRLIRLNVPVSPPHDGCTRLHVSDGLGMDRGTKTWVTITHLYVRKLEWLDSCFPYFIFLTNRWMCTCRLHKGTYGHNTGSRQHYLSTLPVSDHTQRSCFATNNPFFSVVRKL